MEVNIINKGKHPLPNYETTYSAGMDIRANIEEDITLKPRERKIIGTGLYIELPIGYEAQVRSRSGLAYKNGLTVLNSPGTVDSDYRGELKVLLINHSNEEYTVTDGTRIAQMIISKHERVVWNEAELLGETERGAGGYGSTGI